MSEHRPWFVFSGGGTGGHLFPALAVVELLRERDVPVDVSFFCTQRSIDREILGQAGVEAIPLPVRPFSTRPWRWPAFWTAWRRSVSACRRRFAAHRPAVVVGAGGYASGAPMVAAIKAGIPTFILNPDAVPGRANRYLGKRFGIDGVFAQWPVTCQHFPAHASVMVTGCPVRRAFRQAGSADADSIHAVDEGMRVASIRESFGLSPQQPTLLITGASQGARTINEAMICLAPKLRASGWQVLHLSGALDRDRVASAYSEAGVQAIVLAFTDRMPEAMVACDLIVSRAGASTLAEILVVGKPSILMPYPFHRDMHQRHNADVLVKAGAAVLLDDVCETDANARRLEPVLKSLTQDVQRRERMAASARDLARPRAAADIADQLCQVAGITREKACENCSAGTPKFLSQQGV